MGNNESLPPPPPPGQQPPVPQGPPPYTPPPQQYTPPPYNPAPEYPPTQQMPPAQAYTPPTQAYPQQPYAQPGYQQQGYNPNQPPPKKKNNGLLIGGGLAAVAALIGGVVVFTGGDDDKGGTLGNDTTTAVATTIDGSVTTIATATTLDTGTTLNITAPPPTDPPPTATPTTANSGGEVQTLIDDTARFSVVLPGAFQSLTTPITTDAGVNYARIAGSENLATYAEDEDTFGIFILIGETATAGSPTDVINSLDPGTTICPDGTNVTGFSTTLGNAEVLELDGCGTGGAYAKVLMAIALPAQGLVVVAVAQGIGPSDGSLLTFTQAVFETVQLL